MSDSYVVGSSEEVEKFAKDLVDAIKKIVETNGKGTELLNRLGQTSKDESYDTASKLVKSVAKMIGSCAEPTKEVSIQLKKYAEFLDQVSKS